MYRVWDTYTILDEIGRCARVIIPGPPRVKAGVVGFPSLLHLLDKLGEDWWEPIEAARVGFELVWRARYLQLVEDPATGRLREETIAEAERRLKTLDAAVTQEVQSLAEQLPNDEKFWKEHLGMHSRLVIHLHNGNFDPLARLCANQLSAAVRLGEMRLGKPRRKLRALVGHVEADLTAPALTAAGFSVELKAFDAALDDIEKMLPEYNAAMPAALPLTIEQVQRFLEFLATSGLQQWYTELTAVTWRTSMFWDQTYDQRVAVVYGRVRTLCALLEEDLLSFAEHTGDATFRDAVEQEPMLQRRLVRFLRGRTGSSEIVDVMQVRQLAKANNIRPGMEAPEVGSRLLALGIPSRRATQRRQSPEQALASLIVVRNLTTHRFPILRAGERVSWFVTWDDHLPAINRAVLWAALILWAIANRPV